MERVLADIPHNRCVVYLDNLLAHATGFQGVLQNLHDVLQAIRRARLHLNPQPLPSVEADGEINPLEWWRQHMANFPQVASLAKKYLCIQATSAPSERAFSTSGNIITCRRSALKPERVDQLVFLARNL